MSTAAKKGGAKRPSRSRPAKTAARKTSPPATPVAEHSEHPETPADSTVKHQGEGFPQGEGDITPPALAAAKTVADQKDAALEAHFQRADASLGGATSLDDILKDALADSRLDESEIVRVTEALPVGIIIEHEAPNRWRCHKIGEGAYGHGRTHLEAVESYVLGLSATSATDAAARAFIRLPAEQRQEIVDRDAAAAESVGGSDPMAKIRADALKTAKLQATADPRAPGAATDGAERASATQKGSAKAKAATRRANASKRTSRAKR